MDQERLAFLALNGVPGIGGQLIKQLISYCGSAQEVLKKPKGKLLKIPGIGRHTVEAITSTNMLRHAEQELRKCEKENTNILLFTDKQYPSRLKAIEDSPAFIYFKGTGSLNPVKCVGIVGTRQATSYGKKMVEQIVEGLAAHGAMIISGLAYGIDIHAHKLALKHKLPTVGVLGSGIDVIYPSAHRETALKMMDRGGLVTENAFGVMPDAHNFPSRNRIIAGMSDAVIVVEAAEKGGALITADIANSYNKDVFAVPGDVGNAYSAGCNKLIRTNKASLLTSISDLEYLMNWTPGTSVNQKDPMQKLDQTFSPEHKQVVAAIIQKGSSMQIDELAWKTGISLGVLSGVLLDMELRNIIQSLPGKSYKLS